jgi:hypothetical protein
MMRASQLSTKNVDSTFFVEYGFFRILYPVFQHSSLPSFHAAYLKGDRKNRYLSSVL